MDIFTVRDNLKSTINCKEQLLTYWKSQPADVVSNTMIRVIEINLRELNTILGDIEQCCKQHETLQKDNLELIKDKLELGWQVTDRQGGI